MNERRSRIPPVLQRTGFCGSAMKIQIKDTHEAKLLIVGQGEAYSPLEEKLIESIDSRYILKPVGNGTEDGVFSFDISELESFAEYLVNRKLSRTEMAGFLAQLKSVIFTLEDHMLTDANLLMDPAYVYIDRFNRKVRFIPVCQLQGSFGSRLKPLVEAMFLHADLADTESLRFAASMLRTAMRGEIRMHDLMELIENRQQAVREQTCRPELLTASAAREPVDAHFPVANPVREENIRLSSEFSCGNEEVTMRLSEEECRQSFPLPEEPQEQEKTQKKETGMKGFVSGLLSGIKENFSEE